MQKDGREVENFFNSATGKQIRRFLRVFCGNADYREFDGESGYSVFKLRNVVNGFARDFFTSFFWVVIERGDEVYAVVAKSAVR